MSVPVEQPAERVSVAEYFRREDKAVDRHEYHEGEILMMSGSTYSHVRVSSNLLVTLALGLRGSGCVALNSDMRVSTVSGRRYVYPDVSVICGPPQFDPLDKNKTTLTNPRVIFEVLSESTQGYDRGEKFTNYRRIESLEEYFLISQDEALVEGYLRQPDGTWSFATWQGPDAIAKVRSLNVDLPFAELYAGIELRPEPPPAPTE